MLKMFECGLHSIQHYHTENLGGSCALISRVMSTLKKVVTIVTLLIALLISAHEPPSSWEVPPEDPGAAPNGEADRFFDSLL